MAAGARGIESILWAGGSRVEVCAFAQWFEQELRNGIAQPALRERTSPGRAGP
jgi:hypothetical protein